jgi:hypothetical protein
MILRPSPSDKVSGYYLDAAAYHGFLLDQGSYSTLDVPGATYTLASAISDSGQIVGYYFDTSGGTRGFLLR